MASDARLLTLGSLQDPKPVVNLSVKLQSVRRVSFPMGAYGAKTLKMTVWLGSMFHG